MARANIKASVELDDAAPPPPAQADKSLSIGYVVEHHDDYSAIRYRGASDEAEVVKVINDPDHVNITRCLVLDLLVLTEG